MTMDRADRVELAEAVREASSVGPREFMSESGNPSRDARLWKLLVDQLGVVGLLAPEEIGGAGAGIAEVAVVLEELAGSLAAVPALTSMGIASVVLRLADTPAATALLSELAIGEKTATVCWPSPTGVDVTPVVDAGGSKGGSVSGQTNFVLDGGTSDVFLVPVVIDGRTALVAVETDDAVKTAQHSLDLTREMTSVEFRDAPARIVTGSIDLGVALDLALVLVAAEQIGIAQRCHAEAVSWAKGRVQFDRPIGQFQAIKHALVDLLMSVELARSSLDVAIDAADSYLTDPGEGAAAALGVAASAAKARCADSAMLVADESLHILGGIGFTWEHDAHLYFRRAKTLELLFGSPASHRARFGTHLLKGATVVG